MAVIVTVTDREEKNAEEDQRKFTPFPAAEGGVREGMKFISRYASLTAKQIR
jgi:hypothetical protein